MLGSDYHSDMVTRSSKDPKAASRAMIRWMYEAGLIDEHLGAEEKEQIIKDQRSTVMCQQL